MAVSPENPADPRPPDEQYADALPDDLDVTAYVGPYTFPDIRDPGRFTPDLHAR